MYDIIIIGSGPGGYTGAVRAAQLGKRVAVVERAELGGVCLNWGCIPTKALLKSAQAYNYAVHASSYGVGIEGSVVPVLPSMVDRSRGVASQMNKGVEFLMNKHSVDVIRGEGRVVAPGVVAVGGEEYRAHNIIIATGARPRKVASIPVDGKRIITSREALELRELPSSIIVVGSGAIGLEFASFYSSLGSKVTIVEYLDRVAPLEDREISSTVERVLRKGKVAVMTSTEVLGVEKSSDSGCVVSVRGKKGEQVLEAEMVLSAVGVEANIEGIGLEDVGVEVDRGRIVVDKKSYRTSVEGIYAIGDVIATAALAHVASAEAVACVEGICGNEVVVNYDAIPSCIYTPCEIASVGLSEERAVESGYEVVVGRHSMMASGKAAAVGMRDGVIKLVFEKLSDGQAGKILGAHLVGYNVTEIIAGLVHLVEDGATAHTIATTVYPHPTIAEGVMEAAAEVLHLP